MRFIFDDDTEGQPESNPADEADNAKQARGQRTIEYTVKGDGLQSYDRLGVDIDEGTFIVKVIYKDGFVHECHMSNAAGVANPVEVGDQVIEVNGVTATTNGVNAMWAALQVKPIPSQFSLKLRRKEERRRLAMERTDPSITTEDRGVLMIDEGDLVEGISEHEWSGFVRSCAYKDTPGYGGITCEKELQERIGFKEIKAPSYILDTDNFKPGKRVLFIVGIAKDGAPRAKDIELHPIQKLKKPVIKDDRPLPEDVSWSRALRGDKADVELRPLPVASFSGAKVGLRYLADSDDTVDSVRNSLSQARGTLEIVSRPGGKSSASSSSLARRREPVWTPEEWKRHLQKSGEMLRKGKVTIDEPLSTMELQDLGTDFLGLKETPQEPGNLPDRQTAFDFFGFGRPEEAAAPEGPTPSMPARTAEQRQSKEARWRKEELKAQAAEEARIPGIETNRIEAEMRLKQLVPIGKALEQDRLRNVGGSVADNDDLQDSVAVVEEDVAADAVTIGFSRQAVIARNAQTAKVTKLLGEVLSPRDVQDNLERVLSETLVLQPPQLPELRSSEIFEAKWLLQVLALQQEEIKQPSVAVVPLDHRSRTSGVALNHDPLYALRPRREQGFIHGANYEQILTETTRGRRNWY